MILYNVSIKIEPNIKDDWIKWMKEKHIPDVMNTDIFSDYKFLEITNEEAKDTYAIQYSCKSMDDLNRYFDVFAEALQSEHQKRYVNKFVAFRTIMRDIS